MFKDKKAREAIEQIRYELAYTGTHWDTPFRQSGTPLFKLLNEKLDLILKHLELRYVPESSENKPARLEKLTIVSTPSQWDIMNYCDSGGVVVTTAGTTPKKKRGRPRKK